ATTLSDRGAAFPLASHFVFDHTITVEDDARFELREVAFSTNPGADANLTASLVVRDRATARFVDLTFDPMRSWLLGTAFDDSRIETVRSAHVPTEIYPEDRA